MEKTMKIAELRVVAADVVTKWEQYKGEIQLRPTSLYSLIGLKKTLLERLSQIEETLGEIALRHKGEAQENGTYFIPEDTREAANKDFQDFGDSETSFNYEVIIVAEHDNIPMELFEPLYDFISIEE